MPKQPNETMHISEKSAEKFRKAIHALDDFFMQQLEDRKNTIGRNYEKIIPCNLADITRFFIIYLTKTEKNLQMTFEDIYKKGSLFSMFQKIILEHDFSASINKLNSLIDQHGLGEEHKHGETQCK